MTPRTNRQMTLTFFMTAFGYHNDAWMHPRSNAEEIGKLSLIREMAQAAERAKLDAVFIADSVSAHPLWRGAYRGVSVYEPVVTLAALIGYTDKIGLIGTQSTTFNEPYTVARQFAELDVLSGGRAAWNIVTAINGNENYGRDLPPKDWRYDRATEFVDVVTKLWDSWDRDAIVNDHERGRWVDTERIHRINHVGEHFKCDFHDVIEAGDHYIALGNVRSLRTVRPTNPLLFFRGGYGEFAAKSIVVPDGRGLSEAVRRAQALRTDLEDGARRLGGELTVFARIVSDSVAVASATAAGSQTVTELGVRYPLVPPIGALYVAWSAASEQDAWIGKAVGASPAQRRAYRSHLADIRDHGWAASFVPDDDTGDEGLLPDEITRRMATSAFVLDVREIDPTRRYRVTGLMAPVFLDGGRSPELMIRQLLYPAVETTGEAVLRRGEALKAFAEQASARLSAAAAA